MLRLKLLGCDKTPDQCLEDIGDASQAQLLIEDLFTEILQPYFLPFPPGAKLLDFKVVRGDGSTVTYIATIQSKGRVYKLASRCVIYRARKLCFPVPIEDRGTGSGSEPGRQTTRSLPEVEDTPVLGEDTP